MYNFGCFTVYEKVLELNQKKNGTKIQLNTLLDIVTY